MWQKPWLLLPALSWLWAFSTGLIWQASSISVQEGLAWDFVAWEINFSVLIPDLEDQAQLEVTDVCRKREGTSMCSVLCSSSHCGATQCGWGGSTEVLLFALIYAVVEEQRSDVQRSCYQLQLSVKADVKCTLSAREWCVVESFCTGNCSLVWAADTVFYESWSILPVRMSQILLHRVQTLLFHLSRRTFLFKGGKLLV